MTISYSWLSEYLPVKIDPERLCQILTSIGLEVEHMEKFEALKGGLKGLVIGEVLSCSKHPDADKLSVTSVNIGGEAPLQIVCGAPNVAVGQKVVVATIGATIYPISGEPLTMKKAKIRGVESHGMICAEDEIGLSENHAGIMVLPNETEAGIAAAAYFHPYEDFIIEIGLTPNRMDAMSHLGVAKDVCAYLSHHEHGNFKVKSPLNLNFESGKAPASISVEIENRSACQRYCGIGIEGIKVAESPVWLKERISAIGLRPINNIVDITNYILHETGQPLHAFDADTITGNKIVVKNLPEGTSFITLDEKERKLGAEDLMICNAVEPMCIGGVFGGLHSGVSSDTKRIFLESAWFHPSGIRKTSLKHGLRTDAATRFEKGVDISQTADVLKRAALLIRDIAGGEINADIIDIYPEPAAKTMVTISYDYIQKLSGKTYEPLTIKNILSALGFEILIETADSFQLSVPYSKPDISIPADIVEEIMRIDGLDNIEIPAFISIAPAVDIHAQKTACKEKTAGYLTGNGFNEIFTNSITNSAYYDEQTLSYTVRMMNSLSKELDVMRPNMLETGLETVVYNLNRKNNDLKLFEFGKTYSKDDSGSYKEQQHLSLFVTGKIVKGNWKSKSEEADFYYMKGIVESIVQLLGIEVTTRNTVSQHPNLSQCFELYVRKKLIAQIGVVSKQILQKFDIKQPVFYADIFWDTITDINEHIHIEYTGIPKFPSVNRDLALIVDRGITFEQIELATKGARVNKLISINLFDIFESDKLGDNKKSMAVSFTFLDEEKTMTDKEIDQMMSKLIASYQKELGASIRN